MIFVVLAGLLAVAALMAIAWPMLRSGLKPKGEPTSPEAVICQMVDLRMALDKRIQPGPPSGQWMISELWVSPEGELLRACTRALWLEDGGLSAADAWCRICPSAAEEIAQAPDADQARRLGAAGVLKAVDPLYPALGNELIGAVIARKE